MIDREEVNPDGVTLQPPENLMAATRGCNIRTSLCGYLDTSTASKVFRRAVAGVVYPECN
jgi:hypothetical protein